MKKFVILLMFILASIVQAADTELQDLAELVAIASSDVLYVVDDPAGAPASRKITALNLFDMIDTFAELQAITADETLVSEEATPTLDALWTFDLGLTITTGDPLTFGVNRIDNGADLLDGEMIGDDTIDDDSIDWSDCTFADFDFESTWKMWHSDAAGDVIEITLGADGTFLESNGPAANPAFRVLVDGDVPDDITIDLAASATLATLATTVTLADDDATADPHDIVFTTDAAGPVNLEADIDDFHYNPSTGTCTATEFAGGGGSLTGIDAATGDSATAFFDAGTIEHEWGGLQADVSAWTGLFGITGADTTVEVDTSAEMATAITDETGTGKLTFATAPVFTTSIQLTGADADPAAAAGTIAYDNTIAVMSGGGLRWYDDNSVRLIVDLETDPSNDDHVIAYDAAADGFYMKADATGGNTAWDDIGDPDAAATVDFVTYTQTIDIGVTDDGGPKSGLILDVTGLGAGVTDVIALEITTATDGDTDYIPIAVYDDSGVGNDLLFRVNSTGEVYTAYRLRLITDGNVYQSADNYISFSDSDIGDVFEIFFGGTDVDLIWSDGALNLRNNENGVDAIVEIEGKDAGEKGILRVLSDGDDKYIELLHNDTDGYITANSGSVIANTNLSVGNGATTAGVLTLLEDTDAGANFASFMVPALAANTVYTLPPDDGDNLEVLQTNGAGTLTWSAAGTGNMNTATYDAGVSGGVDQITTVDSTYASDYVVLTGTAVGTDAPKTDGALTYDATSGTLAATLFTQGGQTMYDADDVPSGSLGGTYAAITIDDLFIKLGGDVASAGDYDFGEANVDLEIPQASPAVPAVDGQIEYDFTDGKLVIQHGSAHAELGASTDVVVGTLIKSWGGTIMAPDQVNDVITVKAVNSIEFPHGVVITAVYLGVSSDNGYVLTVQNFDDFDTINGAQPTIDTVTYPADTTGEIIDTTPTFATIAAGQIIMISIPATDVDWIHFEIYYYEPAA